ncbi:MAG: MBL fold metallo-hydrolase [Clostridia bacterium]|nr:MBL fold metallo-hydrolase [Clostridia bacterium]
MLTVAKKEETFNRGVTIKKWLIYVLLCVFTGCFLHALAEEDAASAQTIENDDIDNSFWICDNYMLYVESHTVPPQINVIETIYETGNETIWSFRCDENSKKDHYTAVAYSVERLTYDENNLLDKETEAERPCETTILLNKDGLVTIENAPDSRLENRLFREVDEDGEDRGRFFALNEKMLWWLDDTPFDQWMLFREVEIPGENWFWVHKMPHLVYALYEPFQDQGVISYLIPGNDSALLWDTGMGISNIRDCVEALTDLPVTVLNSHDHFDHTGGNHLFESVMCYNMDSAIQTLTKGYPHIILSDYVDPETIVDMPEDFEPDAFNRIGKAPTATVEDGQILDLGGRKLEVIHTPGHSAASIMLLDEENGLLFTGDTWYPGALYAFLKDSSLPDYVKSMRKVEKIIREKNVEWIYGSHECAIPGRELFFETADFLENVLNGRAEYEIIYDMGNVLKKYTLNDYITLEVLADESELAEDKADE